MKIDSRISELMSKALDDELTPAEYQELVGWLEKDGATRQQWIDQLLLDSLLDDELGCESLTALVDMVADKDACEPLLGKSVGEAGRLEGAARGAWPIGTVTPAIRPARSTTTGKFIRRAAGWGMAVACLVGLAFILFDQASQSAYASASRIVLAAMQTHAEPIERVYAVEIERSHPAKSRVELPRDVRVSTQGDQFWVEMHDRRRWAWGRDLDGSIWMTLGPRRAVVIDSDEMGLPLQLIGDVCALQLETLLQSLLKGCRLEKTEGNAGTDVITAVPLRHGSERPLRKATIEVDRETKAIRRLVIDRTFQDQSTSVVTFRLVDSRLADMTKYRPEGHLSEPFRTFARETPAAKRLEFVVHWMGAHAQRWILAQEKVPENLP